MDFINLTNGLIVLFQLVGRIQQAVFLRLQAHPSGQYLRLIIQWSFPKEGGLARFSLLLYSKQSDQ